MTSTQQSRLLLPKQEVQELPAILGLATSPKFEEDSVNRWNLELFVSR